MGGCKAGHNVTRTLGVAMRWFHGQTVSSRLSGQNVGLCERFGRMTLLSIKDIKASGVSVCVAALLAFPVHAQESAGEEAAETEQPRRSATRALTETVVVTARKRGDEEAVQSVPIAVTALGEAQLDALKVDDLEDLTYTIPNVSLADIGTANGTANFTIRGVGVNSSIPSIDPAVGVFVDGVYYGINSGVVLDIFDLESIEVLRGPQGVLFGRNVTGGAVVINTKKPTDVFEAAGKALVESGLRGTGITYNLQGYVSGPIIEDKLLVKFAGYYRNDEGWFENQLTGDNIGAAESYIVRPSLTWFPWDDAEVNIRYEHGDVQGDGPVAQSHTNGFGTPGTPVNFDRESFDASIDEVGFQDTTWDQVIADIEFAVPFGQGGTVTNIFGWRKLSQDTLGDIDAQPLFIFHAPANLRQEQYSNELRYFGRFFDRMDLTTGVFYFTQTLDYAEQRDLLGVALGSQAGGVPALVQTGGGIQEHDTIGVFGNVDIDITDRLILSGGLRWSREEKEVQIANLVFNQVAPPAGGIPCNVVEGTCPFDFVDDESWTSLSSRLGLKFIVNENTLTYATWARSFRSGGYNLRNTAVPTTPEEAELLGPGPFDQEEVSSFEIGAKNTFMGGRGTLNVAGFYTLIDDMQREVNLPSEASGVLQLIRNTADARLFGFEAEGQFAVLDNFLLRGSVGYTNGEYTEVRFDLNGDGLVNSADEELDIPRLAPLTYNVGFVYDYDLGDIGIATLRFNYAHRDESAFTDNNRGILNAADIIDAGLDLLTWDDRAVLSFYGKNLLNDVQHGNDTQLGDTLAGFPLGGTFAPLTRGRTVGVELRVTYN